MSWPVPTPDQTADRAATIYEARLVGIDARSRNRVATATTRVIGTTATTMHLHIAAQASELMPTTAVETLDAKAAMWGLTRGAGSYAGGNGTVTSAEGATIPAGLLLTAGSYLARTAAATEIGAAATSVPLASATLGSVGDIPAGTVLVLSSPVQGLDVQAITVDANGVADGVDAETDDELRARLLIEVRKGDEDGTVYYRRIALAVYPEANVAVIRNSVGAGTVSVVFAMPGPITPTDDQVSAVDVAVQAGRSVGVREAFTLGATVTTVDVQLQLNPDTAATRAAALAGLQASFAADATIGGTVYVSRLDNAVSSVSGEYSHERLAPAADVVLGPTAVAALGQVTWG